MISLRCFQKNKNDELFLSSPSACRMSGASKNRESSPTFSVHFFCHDLSKFKLVAVLMYTSVSNGTGQCNFWGQRDRNSFLVPGQRDSWTSSKSCHGTGRDFDSLSCPGTSCETEMKEKALKKWDFLLIFLHHPVFEHTFSVLEHPFPVLELPFLF